MAWLIIVEWLARIVLVLLIALSVWSVSIMVDRRRFFRQLNSDSLQKKSESTASRMLSEISAFKQSEKIEKAFEVFVNRERVGWETGLPVLGTLGSTSPFIGLFGTILGIIVSFGQLSSGQGNTNSVMFALAEALILTAVGLVVAIPSVIAFNYFSRQVREQISNLAREKDLYLLQRD